MATLAIRKPDGGEAGSLEVSDVVFGAEPNLHCVRAAVDQYRASQRAGTHSTKTRGAARGGGRKPHRQKGTGRARHGSTRSPIWTGGGVAFGPHPRNYSYKINRKVRRTAYRTIWSELARSGRLVVIDVFGIEKPKTRRMVEILGALGVEGKALVVSKTTNEGMALSARNIPGVKPINAENLNVYDLVTHDWVVVTADVIKHVEAAYQ